MPTEVSSLERVEIILAYLNALQCGICWARIDALPTFDCWELDHAKVNSALRCQQSSWDLLVIFSVHVQKGHAIPCDNLAGLQTLCHKHPLTLIWPPYFAPRPCSIIGSGLHSAVLVLLDTDLCCWTLHMLLDTACAPACAAGHCMCPEARNFAFDARVRSGHVSGVAGYGKRGHVHASA
jgi:hypothetical protein